MWVLTASLTVGAVTRLPMAPKVWWGAPCRTSGNEQEGAHWRRVAQPGRPRPRSQAHGALGLRSAGLRCVRGQTQVI